MFHPEQLINCPMKEREGQLYLAVYRFKRQV
jgi:hypothetical protein